jgi:hypothetical protein
MASTSAPVWVVAAALSRLFKKSAIWREVLFVVLVCISPRFLSLVRELLIDYFVYYFNRELTCGTLYGHVGEVKLTVCRGIGRRRRPEGGDMDINDPALAVVA